MNWDTIKGNWNQAKGNVKQQWAMLTEDDLTMIDGQRDELVGKLQERYGLIRDEAERQINAWERVTH